MDKVISLLTESGETTLADRLKTISEDICSRYCKYRTEYENEHLDFVMDNYCPLCSLGKVYSVEVN